jgi:hypothetical protein
MTHQELDYIKRAVSALESGDCTDLAEIKILRTVSQITDRAAEVREQQILEQFERALDQ